MVKISIILPKPLLKGKMTLEEAIFQRESIRSYNENVIEDQLLSQIFWAAQGKKGSKRTVPSAGATYPLEIFATIKIKGFFHYDQKNHLLELITPKDLSIELSQASWKQLFMIQPYMILIICAEFQRTCNRYGERGIRYVHIEVGHCAQNVHLIACSNGLDSVPIGAFKDKEIKSILNLPDHLEPIYIIPIGYKK